jgi:methylated-DNA-protein-cysteine methyltransferase-like protein
VSDESIQSKGREVAAANFEDDVRQVLKKIPRGTVMTYGEVAEEAGHAGAARAVGNFLAHSVGRFPWWRIVTANGRLVPGNEREHATRLEAEGVKVSGGRVVMSSRRRV